MISLAFEFVDPIRCEFCCGMNIWKIQAWSEYTQEIFKCGDCGTQLSRQAQWVNVSDGVKQITLELEKK
jgi:hypothetical protein